jgi:hypothetical protein
MVRNFLHYDFVPYCGEKAEKTIHRNGCWTQHYKRMAGTEIGGGWGLFHKGATIVGLVNGTLVVPELPTAWGYSWATLSLGVINTER